MNNNKNRNKIFLAIIIVVLIILVTITIVRVIKYNSMKKEQEKETNEAIEEIKYSLSEDINENASPDKKPSIAGNENVKIEGGLKINISPKIAEDRNFENYTFTNIRLEANSSGTVLTAKVSSSSKEKIKGKTIVIKFYDNQGKLVSMMNAYIGQIKPDETIDFRAESTSDLTNAYDMEILAQ